MYYSKYHQSTLFAVVICLSLLGAITPGLSQNGNVGIGTETPESLLHLKSENSGDTTGVRMTTAGLWNTYMYNSGTDLILRNGANTNQLLLDETGNVGIGTDNPLSRLHIMSNNQGLRLDGTAPALFFYTGETMNGLIRHSSSNMILTNQLAGKLIFDTKGVTRVVIDSSGKTGVNTGTPAARLHVRQANEAIRVDGQSSRITFYDDSTGIGYIGHNSDEMFIYNTTENNLNFGADNSTKMTIKSNGNVGVGTQNPSAKLHVKASEQGDSSGLILTAPTNQNALIYIDSQDVVIRKADRPDQLVLDASGRIGVGTNDPLAKLHILSNTEGMRIDANNPSITMYDGSTYMAGIIHSNNNLIVTNILDGKLNLGTNNVIGATLNNNNYLGLGTQDPLAKLHLASQFGGDSTGVRLTSISPFSNSLIYNSGADLILSKANIENQLVLDGTGRIGIGTDSPNGRLHVDTENAFNTGIFESSSSFGTWLTIGNEDTEGAYYHMISTGSGTVGGAGQLLFVAGESHLIADTVAIAINGDGRVGIGTMDYATGYMLSVDGKIMSDGVRVQSVGSWPDYVFEGTYSKPTLDEVEAYIETNGHLPGFLPASIVEAEGLDMAEITIQQQEWIEVSTLHMIEQAKRISALENIIQTQTEQIDQLLKSLQK